MYCRISTTTLVNTKNYWGLQAAGCSFCKARALYEKMVKLGYISLKRAVTIKVSVEKSLKNLRFDDVLINIYFNRANIMEIWIKWSIDNTPLQTDVGIRNAM